MEKTQGLDFNLSEIKNGLMLEFAKCYKHFQEKSPFEHKECAEMCEKYSEKRISERKYEYISLSCNRHGALLTILHNFLSKWKVMYVQSKNNKNKDHDFSSNVSQKNNLNCTNESQDYNSYISESSTLFNINSKECVSKNKSITSSKVITTSFNLNELICYFDLFDLFHYPNVELFTTNEKVFECIKRELPLLIEEDYVYDMKDYFREWRIKNEHEIAVCQKISEKLIDIKIEGVVVRETNYYKDALLIKVFGTRQNILGVFSSLKKELSAIHVFILDVRYTVTINAVKSHINKMANLNTSMLKHTSIENSMSNTMYNHYRHHDISLINHTATNITLLSFKKVVDEEHLRKTLNSVCYEIDIFTPSQLNLLTPFFISGLPENLRQCARTQSEILFYGDQYDHDEFIRRCQKQISGQEFIDKECEELVKEYHIYNFANQTKLQIIMKNKVAYRRGKKCEEGTDKEIYEQNIEEYFAGIRFIYCSKEKYIELQRYLETITLEIKNAHTKINTKALLEEKKKIEIFLSMTTHISYSMEKTIIGKQYENIKIYFATSMPRMNTLVVLCSENKPYMSLNINSEKKIPLCVRPTPTSSLHSEVYIWLFECQFNKTMRGLFEEIPNKLHLLIQREVPFYLIKTIVEEYKGALYLYFEDERNYYSYPKEIGFNTFSSRDIERIRGVEYYTAIVTGEKYNKDKSFKLDINLNLKNLENYHETTNKSDTIKIEDISRNFSKENDMSESDIRNISSISDVSRINVLSRLKNVKVNNKLDNECETQLTPLNSYIFHYESSRKQCSKIPLFIPTVPSKEYIRHIPTNTTYVLDPFAIIANSTPFLGFISKYLQNAEYVVFYMNEGILCDNLYYSKDNVLTKVCIKGESLIPTKTKKLIHLIKNDIQDEYEIEIHSKDKNIIETFLS